MNILIRPVLTIGLIGAAISGLPLMGNAASRSQFSGENQLLSTGQLLVQRGDRVSWWKRLIYGERRSGGRDETHPYFNDRVCLVSPNGMSAHTWSAQPTFVWLDADNVFHKVEVYSENKGLDEHVWAEEVGAGTAQGWHVMSPPNFQLEDNVTYYLALRTIDDEGSPDASDLFKFELLPEGRRAEVTRELEAAGVDGRTASWDTFWAFAAYTTEKDGRTEPTYFLDMARVLFSMPASTERDAYISEIQNSYCTQASD